MSAFKTDVTKQLHDIKSMVWIHQDLDKLPYLLAHGLTHIENLPIRDALLVLGNLQFMPDIGGATLEAQRAFKEELKKRLIPLGQRILKECQPLLDALKPLNTKSYVRDLHAMLGSFALGDFSRCLDFSLWLQTAKQTRRITRHEAMLTELEKLDEAFENTDEVNALNASFVNLAGAIYDYQISEEAREVRKGLRRVNADDAIKSERRAFFETLTKYISEFRPLELLALLNQVQRDNALQFSPQFIKRLKTISQSVCESIYRQDAPHKLREFRQISERPALEQQLFLASEYEGLVRLGYISANTDIIDPAEDIKTITPGALKMVAHVRQQTHRREKYHPVFTGGSLWQQLSAAFSRFIYRFTHSTVANAIFNGRRQSYIDDLIETPHQSPRKNSIDKEETLSIIAPHARYNPHQLKLLNQHTFNYYVEAANSGHMQAKIELARFHEEGFGVKKNLKLALSLYLQVPRDATARYRAGTLFEKNPLLVKDGSHHMMAAMQWVACVEHPNYGKKEVDLATTHSMTKAARKLANLCINDALVYVHIKNNHPEVLTRLITATQFTSPLVSQTLAAWQANDKGDSLSAAKHYLACLTLKDYGTLTSSATVETCIRSAKQELRNLALKHKDVLASLTTHPGILKQIGVKATAEGATLATPRQSQEEADTAEFIIRSAPMRHHQGSESRLGR
jgi:hypothetical protein